MNKAKKRATERYWLEPNNTETQEKYAAYVEGYNQAEKDVALTIEDIKKIHTFLYAIKNNKQGVFTFTRLSDEQYQEILKRLNNQKRG